ncbi:MAG TPA: ATP-binding cassette domain-containing protein [Ruminiclostridium sp.]|nr:ATP-binding cassette domain-containing protein [Ruminiclostridium sp.]
MEEILRLDNVVKRYGQKTVVNSISMTVKKGEIFGLLGPNGAGKSTTINMICGLTPITDGKITVFDFDNSKDLNKIKPRLGLVPQELAMHYDLKAWENLELFGGLYGLKGEKLKAAIDKSLDFTGLKEFKNKFPKSFSGGMKRRLNIACSIIHEPELLIFDEPTVGIDPQSRNHILDSIRTLNKNGATVIYTSHYMEEVEALCSRIAIIDNGNLIAMGTKSELCSLISSDPEKTSLEEVFLNLTGKNLRDYGEEG